MKNCQRCNSARVIRIRGKTSDCFGADGNFGDYDGYVPDDIGIGDGSGDMIYFKYCLDCGQIQGKFPLPVSKMEKGKSED